MTDQSQHDRDSAELRRLCQDRDDWKAKHQAERARCAQAIRDTLANWRCVPSAHIREFAELAIKAIEKGAP
jgi:hypothetical protein